MTFQSMREWLARKLEHADDLDVAAGGTSLEYLRRDAESRTVTPAVLAESPTEIGKVIRFVREQRGWSRRDLADLADIDEADIASIETSAQYFISPSSVIRLAEVCGFSKNRFQQLANHVAIHEFHSANDEYVRFAARSNGVGSVTRDEFDAVCALIEVLTKRDAE
jgi:transcriptional regulator with XRE-family HTH domain